MIRLRKNREQKKQKRTRTASVRFASTPSGIKLVEGAKVRILHPTHYGEVGEIWRIWLDYRTVEVKTKEGIFQFHKKYVEVIKNV